MRWSDCKAGEQRAYRGGGRCGGFTLVEVVALIVIVVVLLCLMLPARNAGRRRRDAHVNRAHLRGLHQGGLFFAESNNGWYPGFDRDGKLDTEHRFDGEPQSTDWNGYDQSAPRAPAWRFRRLIEQKYFGGDLWVSPSERRADRQLGEAMTPDQFSYALLKIEGEADSPRQREHRKTGNSMAIVISDRAIRNGSGYKSVRTHPKGPDVIAWRGDVCWNDNHVTFETTAVLPTRYDQVANDADNLFSDSSPSGVANAEAAMAWKSAGDTDAELME